MTNFLEKMRQIKVNEFQRGKFKLFIDAETKTNHIPIKFTERFSKNKNKIEIIAEVKFSSPSEGIIHAGLSVVDVGRSYIENGAVALSVLTESEYFNGDTNYLRLIRDAYPDVPLLMKDFILFEEQIDIARLMGADAVLLIVKMLDDNSLIKLFEKTRSLGLTAVVEVCDEQDLDRALTLNPNVIQINNRNLVSLDVDVTTVSRLLKNVPDNILTIGASGFAQPSQLLDLQRQGCHHFLIGTALMANDEPGDALRELLEGVNCYAS